MDKLAAKILIIEDDPSLSALYEKIFKDNQFSVFTTDTAEEGIKIAKEQVPSLIILDIVLPQMSGKHGLQLLKSDLDTKDIPVIILSNMDDPELEKECMKLGADDFMVKSNVDVTQLVAKVTPFIV